MRLELRNQAFGFIFQEFALIEDDTVFENVKIPLLYSNKRKWSHKKEVEKQVLQTLYDYLDETKILVMATHDLKEIKMENKKLLLAEGKICT